MLTDNRNQDFLVVDFLLFTPFFAEAQINNTVYKQKCVSWKVSLDF